MLKNDDVYEFSNLFVYLRSLNHDARMDLVPDMQGHDTMAFAMLLHASIANCH